MRGGDPGVTEERCQDSSSVDKDRRGSGGFPFCIVSFLGLSFVSAPSPYLTSPCSLITSIPNSCPNGPQGCSYCSRSRSKIFQKRYQKSSKESMLARLWSRRSAWRSIHNRRCHGLRLVNRSSFLQSQHNPFQNIVASSFTPAWNPITNFLSSHNLISRLNVASQDFLFLTISHTHA